MIMAFNRELLLFETALAAFALCALILIWPLISPQSFRRRIHELTSGMPKSDSSPRTSDRLASPELETRKLYALTKTSRRLAQFSNRSFSDLKTRLKQAGIRSPHAATLFVVVKMSLPFVVFFLAGPFLSSTIMTDRPVQIITLVALLAAIGAIWVPDLTLANLKVRYLDRIRRDWPDALDLIYLCIEAGLSLEAALSKVARDMTNSAPALAQEVTLTVAELAFLQNRREAIENLGRRIDLPAVREATRAIAQAQYYGMPLGATLRNLAEESRRQRIAEVEKKSASLPSRLRVPLILFLLPVLFAVILGPAAIEILGLP